VCELGYSAISWILSDQKVLLWTEEKKVPSALKTLTRMVPRWFEPTTSREDAIQKLQTSHTGSFLIRQSSQPGTLALSLRTGPGEDDIQHFIIISRNGSVALEDSDLEFDSLVSFVNHYSSHRDELPVRLKMSSPSRKTSAPGGFMRGDSPYVSMVGNHGRQRTKSTIWVNSPVFRTNEAVKSRDLEVIQSVLQQGSNLEDSFSSLLSQQLEQLHQSTEQQDEQLDQSNKQTDKSSAVTSIRVNESVERDPVVNDADNDDDYEDYSLPIDVANSTNLYEDPETTAPVHNKQPNAVSRAGGGRLPSPIPPSISGSPRTRGGRLPSPAPQPNRRLSYLAPHRQLEHIDERLLGEEQQAAAADRTTLAAADRLAAAPGSPVAAAATAAVTPKVISGKSSSLGEARPRFRKNNSVVVNQFRPAPPQAPVNLSKSCSNIFEELEKRNEENKNFRRSFVRKVSLNLSVRRNNNLQPIRKISSAMKRMFPAIPKTFASLVNSQENSDSWEYLADCGVSSPVYEEVKDVIMSNPNNKLHNNINSNNNNNNSNKINNNNKEVTNDHQEAVYCDIEDRVASSRETQQVSADKLIFRSGSIDSLYESEYTGSNPTSIERSPRCGPACSTVNSGSADPLATRQGMNHITRIRVGNPPQMKSSGLMSCDEIVHYV